MGLRINDAAVAFAADDGSRFLHLRHHVHLAHGRGGVGAAVFLGHVAQGTRGAQVRHGVARRVLQHVVGTGDERILLAIHAPVLTDDGKAVDVGVDGKGDVVLALAHEVHEGRQVLLERLGIMAEIARRIGIKPRHLRDAQLPQQFWQDDATHGVDRIDGHAEVGGTDGVDVDESQVFHQVDMALIVVEILRIIAQMVDVGIVEVALVGQAHHLGCLFGGQELALLVEELQGVPLAGVVAGGDDDAAAGFLHRHGKLRRGRRGQPDVENVEAHAEQRTAHHVRYHFTGDTGITAHDYLARIALFHAVAQGGVCRHRFDDVERIEGVSRLTSDGAAKSRDRLD